MCTCFFFFFYCHKSIISHSRHKWVFMTVNRIINIVVVGGGQLKDGDYIDNYYQCMYKTLVSCAPEGKFKSVERG